MPESYHYLYGVIGTLWGLSYIYAFLNTDSSKVKSASLIIGILLLHLSALFSGPILEDDFFRYSWDGRNIRQGIHPYSQSPYEQVSGTSEAAKDDSFDSLGLDQQLENLPEYTRKINYPMYRTVYPPLCEFLFVSEILVKDTHLGWIVFILLTDLLLIYLLINKSKLSFTATCLLLANPLFIKEGLNSLHFDFFLVPLLIYFMLNNKKNKPFTLGLIAGIRPWYLALFLWQIKAWKLKDYLIFSLTICIPWLVLILYPGFPAEGFSSWKAFIKTWEFNAVFYEILRFSFSLFTDSESYFRIAAWVCGFSIIAIIWKVFEKESGWGLVAIAGWLLFLPTVNPWYFMPIATVLIINQDPRVKSIACALCISLPLAYIHYQYIIPGTITALCFSIFEVATAVMTYVYCSKKLKSPASKITCEA
ncbi:MAG: hypothetical protein NE330_02215 [Lentisphaeraceae bacterium]|nr:hypothetical protein [Lentisphaeraceae bacterium]